MNLLSILQSTSTQGVKWNISDLGIVTIVSQGDQKIRFKVIGEGNTDLIATSKDGKLQKTAKLSVVNRNLPEYFSGLSNVEVSGTDWYKDGYAYVDSGSGDGFAMVDEMNYSTATYTFKTDVEIIRDTADNSQSSKGDSAFQTNIEKIHIEFSDIYS